VNPASPSPRRVEPVRGQLGGGLAVDGLSRDARLDLGERGLSGRLDREVRPTLPAAVAVDDERPGQVAAVPVGPARRDVDQHRLARPDRVVADVVEVGRRRAGADRGVAGVADAAVGERRVHRSPQPLGRQGAPPSGGRACVLCRYPRRIPPRRLRFQPTWSPRVPSRDRRALDAAEPVDLGVGLPRSRPRDRVGRRERVAGAFQVHRRVVRDRRGTSRVGSLSSPPSRSRMTAAARSPAWLPTRSVRTSRATPSWKTAVVGTSTARARDELTFGLFAEQRRGTADGAAPGVVGRNDHQRVRSVRPPGKAREVPKVVVEPIADRDERVGVRGRDRLDDRGEIGAERETIARIGVVAPVVHGSGSGTASSACTSSTSSCAGSSRSSLKRAGR